MNKVLLPERLRRAGIVILSSITLWLLLPESLGAQAAQTITFRDAVRIALERNAALRIARNAAALDATGVTQARAQFSPDLRWNAQSSENVGRSFNQSEGRIIDQRTTVFSTGLSSGITLFNGGANTAAVREARASLEASELGVERARQTAVFTVATNFVTLVQEREQLRVRREALAAEEALEQQIRDYVEAGVRPIADLYQQQASVAAARLALVQAQRAAELAEVDLMQTLQLDPRGQYEFAPPEFSELPPTATYSLDSLLQQAFDRRADLDADESRVQAAEQGVRIARAARMPSLSLNAGYNASYTSAADLGFVDQLDQRRGGSIGLSVSLPFLDRRTTSVATERARISLDNARIAAEARQQEVGVQVRRALLDFEAARAQLAAAEAQQRAAELALETSQQRYEVGAATLVELTQVRATLTQAQSALVASRYNVLFQQTLVDYYVGTLNPEFIATSD